MHKIRYELHSFNPAYVRLLEKMGDGFSFVYHDPELIAAITVKNNGHKPKFIIIRQIGNVLMMSFSFWCKAYDNCHTLIMYQQAALDMLNFLYSDPATVKQNLMGMRFGHSATGLVELDEMSRAEILELLNEYEGRTATAHA